jgi:predicted metalloprotease
MRLEDERESQNIEDRRGDGGGFGGGGFNRGSMPVLIGGGGLGTVAIIVVALLLGVDPSFLFQAGDPGPPPQQQSYPHGKPAPAPAGGQHAQGDEDAQRRFVGRVLATTEDAWGGLFQQQGRQYEQPRLVLFSGGTQGGCGMAQSAMGPFYCPRDRQVYLDLSFFQEMERKLGAPGEFARAYVIAHEVGHHVQNLLGIIPRVDAARRSQSEAQSNALSVRLELQADCFAGVWANVTDRQRHFLEPGDIESGLNAAAAVGDDRLQQQSAGRVVPESFTHGSSAQRVRWFRQGYESGDVKRCDTFGADRL